MIRYRDRRTPRPSDALAQAVLSRLDDAPVRAGTQAADPAVAEATYAIGERLSALPESIQRAAVSAYVDAWHVAQRPGDPEGMAGEQAQRALAGVVRGGAGQANETLLLWAALRGYFHGRAGRPSEDLVPAVED